MRKYSVQDKTKEGDIIANQFLNGKSSAFLQLPMDSCAVVPGNHNEHIKLSPLINDQGIKCQLESQARWSKWTCRQEGRIRECLWEQQRQEWDTAVGLREMETPNQTLSCPELMRPRKVPSHLYQSQWELCQDWTGIWIKSHDRSN